MSRLETFVAPRPKPWLIRLMTGVNRAFMLKGLVGLRDLWPFSRVPGLRGVANVRHIDFPAADVARLSAVCGAGKATFITPNHPEFFTDWMIDKEIVSRCSPMAASWATNMVVNGLGPLAQKFWLANNLIAQIPGNSEPAREHSIAWALTGQGVLLHPEGSVGWHSNHVAPLMPGAVEMAREALQREPGLPVFIAPVVWKLVFLGDVEPRLMAECAYIERRLAIGPAPRGLTLPLRVKRLYDALLQRDEQRLGLQPAKGEPTHARQGKIIHALTRRLEAILGMTAQSHAELLRAGRRRLREPRPQAADAKALKSAVDMLTLNLRLGAFAFANPRLTQEELAEHIKRIRNDHCKGTLRDTLNRFVPQPAGPRIAHIRVPQALAMHTFAGTDEDATMELRHRMQAALDEINRDLAARGTLRFYDNPFYAG